MGALCSSLCTKSEEQNKTNPNESPLKNSKENSNASPVVVKTETQPKKVMAHQDLVTNTSDTKVTKKSSDTGSSSHISIKDFSWLKVFSVYLVSWKGDFWKGCFGV